MKKGLHLLQILRPKQWIKNLLVLSVPLSAGKIFIPEILLNSIVSIIALCAVSSSIYILNDIKDLHYDVKHPLKSSRPIASGKIKKSQAFYAFTMLVIFSFLLSIMYSRELF